MESPTTNPVNPEATSPLSLPPLKPGILTCEFWFLVALSVAIVAGILLDKIPPGYGVAALTVLGVAWPKVREGMKKAHLHGAVAVAEAFLRSKNLLPAEPSAPQVQTPNASSPSTDKPVDPGLVSFGGAVPLLLALAFLALPANAAMREIVVTGAFEHGDETALITDTLPLPFVFTAEFDDEAFDWNPSPNLGIYYTPGGKLSLSFADQRWEVIDTEVRVFANEQGLYGFSVGNQWEIERDGFLIPQYFGTYASFLSPTRHAVNGDGLSNVRSASLPLSSGASYLMFAGTLDGQHFRIQDNALATLEVRTVPEQGVMLTLSGLLAVAGFRRFRTPLSE